MRADFRHVEKGVGRTFAEACRSQEFKRGSRRGKCQGNRMRLAVHRRHSCIGQQRTVVGHARRAGQQRRRQREERHWTVVSDLDGSPRTITNAELDVIETYLGSLLDELLPNVTERHDD